MIELSQAAANEIKRLQLSRQKPDSHFRLGVKSGGCSGLFYTLELVDTIQESDRLCETQGIQILVDSQSQIYLESVKLDYSEDLMGGGFRFINPQSKHNCSCGQSFAIEN